MGETKAPAAVPMELKDRLAAWQGAGLIDSATAARIEAFEGALSPVARDAGGIGVAEVVAYIGSVVVLVGVGFLFFTQYEALGTGGRLVAIGLVVVGGLAAGELVRLMGGATGTARRARSAGWAVASLASAAWFAEAFIDAHIFTKPLQYPYPGAPDDTSGSILVAAIIGFVIASGLLWRAGAGLVAFATGALAFIAAGAFDAFKQANGSAWEYESSWLAAAAGLGLYAEVLMLGHERRWAREVLRFTTVVPACIAALAFSNMSDGGGLEDFAALTAVGAFGLALWRGSAGYAIAGGIALFVVVVEVSFRHFAQSVGFPVVLIASGITLFLVAGASGFCRDCGGVARNARQRSTAPRIPSRPLIASMVPRCS